MTSKKKKNKRHNYKYYMNIISHTDLPEETIHERVSRATHWPISDIIHFAGLDNWDEMERVLSTARSLVREAIGEDDVCVAVNQWRDEIIDTFVSTWVAEEYPRFDMKVLIIFSINIRGETRLVHCRGPVQVRSQVRRFMRESFKGLPEPPYRHLLTPIEKAFRIKLGFEKE